MEKRKKGKPEIEFLLLDKNDITIQLGTMKTSELLKYFDNSRTKLKSFLDNESPVLEGKYIVVENI